MSVQYCYNKGCGQQFDAAQNKSDACVFHPGEPVFHDAYKGWSCCQKKCTDFTEFLNIKGCSTGSHNPVKPVEVKTVKPGDDSVITYNPPIPAIKEYKRPDENLPMVVPVITIAPSLEESLSKLSVQDKNSSMKEELVAGTSCKNNSCSAVFSNGPSDFGTCIHHPGYPVFHEGMKFWSCCNRKTSDFDNFLAQEGCTHGEHKWFKEDTKEVTQCRYDWHQTGTHVILTIYSKMPRPAESTVALNPVKLDVGISYGSNIFNLNIILCGVVDVDKSSVMYYQSKVEIKLKKAEPMSWPAIGKIGVATPKQPVAAKPCVAQNEDVDLSDL